MMKHMKTENGFTLIELMIVIAIIGILTAVALPRFSNSTEKAKYAEVKLAFRAVAVAAEAFYAEHGSYPDSIQLLLRTGTEKNPNYGILDSNPFYGVTEFTPGEGGYKMFYMDKTDKVKYTYTKDAKGKVTIEKGIQGTPRGA